MTIWLGAVCFPLRVLLVLTPATAMLVPTRHARAQDSTRVQSSVVLRIDNDLLAIRGDGPPADYDYTAGTHLALTMPRKTVWSIGAELGQEIYTPRHNLPDPLPGDRPYAAWIFGGASFARLARERLDSFDLHIGITGPPALGEQMQNGVHRLLGNHLEEGWSHQLSTHLAIAGSYDVTRQFALPNANEPSRFLAVSAGGTLGNLRREAHAGVQGHWSFGPPTTPIASAPLVRRPGRWYLAAGYRVEYVAHDTFIEGDGGVAGAVRAPWVAQAFVAAGVRAGRFVGEYRYVVRSREYRSEPGTHAIGSIGIAALFH